MTELVWNGKYDKDGKRVGPVRIALPFQTVETVNESAQERQRSLGFVAEGRQTEWRNRLIWGDKKYVLPSLLPEFTGKVNLIYIDPPFDTGADFSFNATIPDHPDSEEDETTEFLKQPSIIEQKAYRDTWGRGMDSYLQWFYETVVLLRELLADDGSIYVHLDWHVGHYAKVVLDEVFGLDSFKNVVTWRRQVVRGMKTHARFMPYSADYIYIYAKGEALWNAIEKEALITIEEAERKYMKDEKGFFRTSDPGTYSNESLVKLFREGRIHVTRGGKAQVKGEQLEVTGGTIGVKYYREQRGDRVVETTVADNIWDDIPGMGVVSSEHIGYATQKPKALLERVIRASSNEGDLVLDCFVGSGTTAAVAEKLGRRWIACDLSRFAVNVTRKRLLSIPGLKPFVIQNLGKYERQQWQGAEFGSDDAATLEISYRRFILDLYHADPIEGHAWLHGVKSGRMVHVGAVDAPVTIGDIKAIVAEFWRAAGSAGGPTDNGVDILGWDFAFDINETAKQLAAEANVDIAFKKIPREVLDKRAVEQGDIYFFELGALSTDVKTEGREVTVSLTDFVVPPDDVPEDVRPSIKHFSQMIDYWAVDWDFKDDAFHNQWQTYRTRKDPKIELIAKHKYDAPGKYSVVIKVVDILGNDTTSAVHVEVK